MLKYVDGNYENVSKTFKVVSQIFSSRFVQTFFMNRPLGYNSYDSIDGDQIGCVFLVCRLNARQKIHLCCGIKSKTIRLVVACDTCIRITRSKGFICLVLFTL